MPLALVQLLRPRQWTKNLLVIAAPAAAGMLNRSDDIVAVAIAFVAFCRRGRPNISSIPAHRL